MVPTTSPLPYSEIARTLAWYEWEITLSIILIVVFGAYLLVRSWQKYDNQSLLTPVTRAPDDISLETLVSQIHTSSSREELCKLGRLAVESKYQITLIPGRSIGSQKIRGPAGDILREIEVYEYA